jgi:hypothetical protein
MRKPVKVAMNTKTHKIESIEVTSPPNTLGGGFFAPKSIDQLIVEQGIHPITDLEALSGAIPEEDVDEFVAEIYRSREP